jgi:hypothetical protein
MEAPLTPQAIGFVGGELVVAWATFNRVEVRSDRNEARFVVEESDSWGPWHPFFASDCLIVAKAGDASWWGIVAFDLVAGGERMHVELSNMWSEPFFTSPHHTSTLISATEDGIAVWDLKKARLRRAIQANGAVWAAQHPSTRRIAYATRGDIGIVHELGLPNVTWAIAGWARLAWGLAGSVLVGGVDGGELEVVDASTGARRGRLPPLGKILATSEDGQWVAFQRGLVDLQSMTVREHDARLGGTREAQAAAFDATTNQFALVGGPFIWRVPV